MWGVMYERKGPSYQSCYGEKDQKYKATEQAEAKLEHVLYAHPDLHTHTCQTSVDSCDGCTQSLL